MTLVRSFSIKWKRNMFCLELMCLAPSGKEKIIKLYFLLPMIQSFITALQKAIKRHKDKLPDEEVRYIG